MQAKEGVIEEGSPAWNQMSKGDQDRRKRAAQDKATKLRSPNFYVSSTRLSLRNLPYSLDEKGLKSLLIAAVHSHPLATLALSAKLEAEQRCVAQGLANIE